MRLAAHDPEGWSNACRHAIATALGLGLDTTFDDALMEIELHPSVWDALMKLASPHIDAAVADYLLSKYGPPF